MKTPPEVLSIRTVDLLMMLHQQWAIGYISCVIEDKEPHDDSLVVPLDRGGPQTERWFKEQFQEIGKMKKRKDGTYYMPHERTKP